MTGIVKAYVKLAELERGFSFTQSLRASALQTQLSRMELWLFCSLYIHLYMCLDSVFVYYSE